MPKEKEGWESGSSDTSSEVSWWGTGKEREGTPEPEEVLQQAGQSEDPGEGISSGPAAWGGGRYPRHAQPHRATGRAIGVLSGQVEKPRTRRSFQCPIEGCFFRTERLDSIPRHVTSGKHRLPKDN